jgi:hypothetical protein
MTLADYGKNTAIFDHCWVLIHDSPPPGSTEERVLDLRGGQRRSKPRSGGENGSAFLTWARY